MSLTRELNELQRITDRYTDYAAAQELRCHMIDADRLKELIVQAGYPERLEKDGVVVKKIHAQDHAGKLVIFVDAHAYQVVPGGVWKK